MKANKRHAAVVLGSLVTAGIVCGVALAGNPHSTPPGQAKKESGASASASLSTAAGVKPSATTSVSGKNTTALASSNQTKLYGNGKTAGQIAMSNGASASSSLYGPGNSQPHKTVCPGAKPTFDVHALKAHGGSCPSTSSTSTSSTTGTAATAGASASVSGSVSASGNASVAGAAHTSHSSSSGGVLGAQHGGAVNGNAKPATPVLGAANFTG
jgi:hypothetical protein